MTASDTAWSESDTGWTAGKSGWPESERDGRASEAGRPASAHAGQARATSESGSGTGRPDPDARETPAPATRPAAYRQLWQPPGRRSQRRQAIGQPYVWDGGRTDPGQFGAPDGDAIGRAGRPARRERSREADALTGPTLTTERAVIGDELRELATWCQIGACVSRHTDADALGEADIRNKAVAAGWCVDLFGRMVCPSCQQRYPVWCARPPADRPRRVDMVPAAGGLVRR
jgi:hypothetical protein